MTLSCNTRATTVRTTENPTGSIGIIGVYIAPDPGAKGDAKEGVFPFPVAEFFDKGITMGSGQAPMKKYNEYLRDLIVNGRAKPSQEGANNQEDVPGTRFSESSRRGHTPRQTTAVKSSLTVPYADSRVGD